MRDTANTKATLCGAAVLVTLATATAEPRYDTKLEQAAMDVIARKIGDIRTGFDVRHVVPAVPAASTPLPAKVASWRTLVAEPTVSTTVGSIQTYSSAAPGAAADPPRPPSRSGRKLPHVLKF